MSSILDSTERALYTAIHKLVRIPDLTVAIEGNTITLEGTCHTYYEKQLAQEALKPILDDQNLDNNIRVR